MRRRSLEEKFIDIAQWAPYYLRFGPPMNTEFYSFGEILWDCLPSGRHAGGAPFNVAAHLVQLGVSASLISAIGRDQLGDEILKVAQDKGVNTQFVTRARIGLPTGTVLVSVDANGNAIYELVQPVAWDEITVLPETLEAVAQCRALIFGSLACRSPYNLDQLNRLLEIEGPMKFFDVNLRPPFADPPLVVDIAKRADVLKLNDDEVGKLASWLRTGEATLNTPRSLDALAEACAAVAKATNTSRICVTRAAEGAALWENGNLLSAPAPKVVIKDTVGAGDSFMAGLMVGLTRGTDTQKVLENACRVGAFVASHNGATPLLPPEIIQEFKNA
jgi:fructokinase